MSEPTWRELTEADLSSVIDNEELEAYRDRATTDGGVDPLPALIVNAVQECRDRIRANRDNTLAPGDTIPVGMIARCLVMIRHRVLTIIKTPIGEDRRREYEDAMAYLKDVAKGLVSIPQPEEATTEPAPPKPKPRYNPGCRTNIHGI